MTVNIASKADHGKDMNISEIFCLLCSATYDKGKRISSSVENSQWSYIKTFTSLCCLGITLKTVAKAKKSPQISKVTSLIDVCVKRQLKNLESFVML